MLYAAVEACDAPMFRGAPRKDGKRLRVWEEKEIGVLDVEEAAYCGGIEPYSFIESPLKLAG